MLAQTTNSSKVKALQGPDGRMYAETLQPIAVQIGKETLRAKAILVTAKDRRPEVAEVAARLLDWIYRTAETGTADVWELMDLAKGTPMRGSWGSPFLGKHPMVSFCLPNSLAAHGVIFIHAEDTE